MKRLMIAALAAGALAFTACEREEGTGGAGRDDDELSGERIEESTEEAGEDVGEAWEENVEEPVERQTNE